MNNINIIFGLFSFSILLDFIFNIHNFLNSIIINFELLFLSITGTILSIILLPSSLKKLLKNFQVEDKGLFPYKFN